MFVWTIGDLVGIVLFLMSAVLFGIIFIAQWLKEMTCKHEKIYENRACNAICKDCGKDLGFIGSWRKNNHD